MKSLLNKRVPGYKNLDHVKTLYLLRSVSATTHFIFFSNLKKTQIKTPQPQIQAHMPSVSGSIYRTSVDNSCINRT